MKKYFYLIIIPFLTACSIKGQESDKQLTNENKEYKFREDLNYNKLNYIENIPIVYIKENGYEAGFQQGELLKKEIKEIVDILHNEVLYTNTIKGTFYYMYMEEKAKELNEFIPEIYQEEMRGIAEGANVKWEDILIINTYDDIIKMSNCSSISSVENKNNTLFFHARNLDYSIESMAGKTIILHYIKNNTTLITFPGLIGALTATNLNGITLTSHTSYTEKTSLGIPTGILYRMIIENAKSIGDVEKILEENKKTIGNNILVSSLNENQSVVFEFTSDEVVKRTNESYVVTTNHFVDEDLSNKYKNSWRGSEKRYHFLENYLSNEKINIESIQKTMSNQQGGSGSWTCVANEGTVQSVIFIPKEFTMYIAKGNKPPVTNAGYLKYDFSNIIQK